MEMLLIEKGFLNKTYKNVFNEGELTRDEVVANFVTASFFKLINSIKIKIFNNINKLVYKITFYFLYII